MATSSSCIERSFSNATKLQQPQKSMMKAVTLEKIVCNNQSAIGLFERVNSITDGMMEGMVKKITDLTVE